MKIKKRIILISVLLVISGLVVSFISLCMVDFKLSKLSNLTYVENEYTDLESFENIDIDSSFNINIFPSADGKIKIDCHESEELYNNVEIKNNILFITDNDTRKWYEKAFALFQIKPMSVDIYLPDSDYKDLEISAGSGDIFVSEGFYFENADLSCSSGDIEFKASSKDEINISCSSGSVFLANSKAKNINLRTSSGACEAEYINAENDITIKSSSGKIELNHCQTQNLSVNTTSGGCELESINADSDIKIESKSGSCEAVHAIAKNDFIAEATSGTVYLDLCDAANLSINTKSGSVRGTLLSEKIFFTNTKSGKVSVPDSLTGGKCEVSTASGSINLEIK